VDLNEKATSDAATSILVSICGDRLIGSVGATAAAAFGFQNRLAKNSGPEPRANMAARGADLARRMAMLVVSPRERLSAVVAAAIAGA